MIGSFEQSGSEGGEYAVPPGSDSPAYESLDAAAQHAEAQDMLRQSEDFLVYLKDTRHISRGLMPNTGHTVLIASLSRSRDVWRVLALARDGAGLEAEIERVRRAGPDSGKLQSHFVGMIRFSDDESGEFKRASSPDMMRLATYIERPSDQWHEDIARAPDTARPARPKATGWLVSRLLGARRRR